jgi:hypothetical protein
MKEKENAEAPAAQEDNNDAVRLRLDEGRADAVEQGQAQDQGKPEQAADLGGDEEGFHVGDLVQKRTGYRFPGKVRAVFTNARGDIRVVVEADDQAFAGMLHIYSPEQLMPRIE